MRDNKAKVEYYTRQRIERRTKQPLKILERVEEGPERLPKALEAL